MKVRVSYTYEIVGDDLAALNRYHKNTTEKITKEMLRQLLIDLGKGGVGEQIYQGGVWMGDKEDKG